MECLVSFLHVIDVRLSSAHCITNQCYHSKFKCNHVQTCTESGSLLSRCPRRDSGEKKLFSFNIQYKYLLKQLTVERGMCVYILINGICFSLD